MTQKVYFIAVGLFFVLMNALLWRSEFTSQDLSVPVPIESVTRRLLDTADDSTLEIRHHGRKIGYCQWAVNLLSTAPDPSDPNPNTPEGMITGVTGYSVDLDGHVTFKELDHVRFNFSLNLSTNQQWQDLHIRLTTDPLQIEVQSQADQETLRLTVTQGTKVHEYSYRFQQLKDPLTVLSDLLGPFWAGGLDRLGIALPKTDSLPMGIGLEWKAQTDRFQIGNSKLPAYRVEAPLIDKYKISILMQKSGEIIRVELPDDLVLVNDKLFAM